MVAKRIIEMHSSAAYHAEAIGNSVIRQKICDIIR
jgi:hypothetical protein